SGLGQFTVKPLKSNGGTIDTETQWQRRTSTFKPAQKVWFPAIASGTAGNGFVMATSDVGKNTSGVAYEINNALESPLKSTLDYSSLTLSFRMYYSKYSNDEVVDNLDYVAVEVSINGGSNWSEVKK